MNTGTQNKPNVTNINYSLLFVWVTNNCRKDTETQPLMSSLHIFWSTSFYLQIEMPMHFLPITSLGNCEEELPKKPVGRLSVNCRPSVDRQVTDSLPTVNQQVTDRL